MIINHFDYENVKEDGTFDDDDGAVEVVGSIKFSEYNGGCGLSSCDCSDGHWICITEPRNSNREVHGVTLKFGSNAEMIKYIDEFVSESSRFRSSPEKA